MLIYKAFCWISSVISSLVFVCQAFFKTKDVKSFKMLPEVLAAVYKFMFAVGKNGYGPLAELMDEMESLKLNITLAEITKKYCK